MSLERPEHQFAKRVHDLANLLTVIRSYAEIARMKLPPGHDCLDEVNEIRDASDRASRILLEWVRVPSDGAKSD
jgi:signal transduction histidine kinase